MKLLQIFITQIEQQFWALKKSKKEKKSGDWFVLKQHDKYS